MYQSAKFAFDDEIVIGQLKNRLLLHIKMMIVAHVCHALLKKITRASLM